MHGFVTSIFAPFKLPSCVPGNRRACQPRPISRQTAHVEDPGPEEWRKTKSILFGWYTEPVRRSEFTPFLCRPL
jgi:hypothetical protein